MVRIVAVDSDAHTLEFLETALAGENTEVMCCETPDEGWETVRTIRPDIVILDHNLPCVTGMDLLTRIANWDPAINVILLSSEFNRDLAVEAIQKGSANFLTKPISFEELREKVQPLIEAAERRRPTGSLAPQLLKESRYCDIIGNSTAMIQTFAMIARIAPHFQSVLVTGPTGSGKELVARALHRMSPVKDKPLLICNCAAIVETLFESELFGHVRGSFTGATADRAGLFELADGGALFLDEFGELPLTTQAKFLRVLQNGEVQRVGSNRVRKVNVRVLAATHRDIPRMVREKQFREDLYYRLSMLEIRLPPLSERREDLPLLTRHFVELYSRRTGKEIQGVTRRVQTVFSRYHWPGNVRELENVLGYACIMTDGSVIDVHDLPERIRSSAGEDDQRGLLTLAEVERRHVRFVYEEVAGRNKLLAAEILGISRATLYRFLGEQQPAPNRVMVSVK